MDLGDCVRTKKGKEFHEVVSCLLALEEKRLIAWTIHSPSEYSLLRQPQASGGSSSIPYSVLLFYEGDWLRPYPYPPPCFCPPRSFEGYGKNETDVYDPSLWSPVPLLRVAEADLWHYRRWLKFNVFSFGDFLRRFSCVGSVGRCPGENSWNMSQPWWGNKSLGSRYEVYV